MNDKPDPAKIAELLHMVANNAEKAIELAAGHRQRALSAGFDRTTAEQMGLALHNEMIAKLFNPKPK